MTLRATTSKSLAIEAAKLGIVSILSLVRVVVLARLLAPATFGLFAIAVALITGIQALTQVGLQKYLIQRKTVDPSILGCAWVFGALRGTAICAATLLSAPFYAKFMHAPEAALVVGIAGLASFVSGLTNPGALMAERSLDYRRIAYHEISSAILNTAVVIVFAYYMRTATALALSQVVAAMAAVILSFLIFEVRMKICFQWKIFREFAGVGWHFLIIGICSYAMIQGDNLLVGAFLGTTLLGYYVVAYKLVDLPLRMTFQITNRVGFSALSRLQESAPRMRTAFIELLDLQTAILFPLIAFVVALAEPLVIAVFGAKWAASVPVVRALGLIMLGRGISLMIVPFIMANGAYRIVSKVKVIETGTFGGGVILGCQLGGVVGAALGGGIGYAVAAALRVFYVVKIGKIPAAELGQRFGAVLLVVVVPTALAVMANASLNAHAAVRLVVSSLLFATSYGAITFFARPKFIERVRQTISAVKGRPQMATALAR